MHSRCAAAGSNCGGDPLPVGLRRSAEANFQHFDAETKKLLAAYAAGVNAFLATDPVLPPEFWIARFKPEPWTPVDSVLWTKVMALDLGGNWKNELLRLQLARRLPLARVQEFIPPYPGDAPLAIRELKSLYGEALRATGRAGIAAAARTAGWFPGRAARAASRSSPTIRTCRSPRRRSGTSRTSARPASTSSAQRCPGARRHHRAQRSRRLGLHQHRARRAGPLPREGAAGRPLSRARRPARVHRS